MRVTLPCRSLTATVSFAAGNSAIDRASCNCHTPGVVCRNFLARLCPAATPSRSNVGHDLEAVEIQATVVIVHTDEDARQRFVDTGARRGQRHCRAVVIAHPAEAALVGMGRIVIEVDGATQIDPAHQGQAVLVAQWGNLDLLAARSLVSPRYRFRRRHGGAGVIEVGAVAVLRRIRDRVALPVQRIGVAGDRFRREIVVAPAVGAPAENLPRQQAAARLELADVARGIGLPPTTVVDDRLVAELRLVVQRQAVVRARNAPDIRDVHRAVVIKHQLARRFVRLVGVTGDAAALEDRLDIAEILDVLDDPVEAQSS